MDDFTIPDEDEIAAIRPLRIRFPRVSYSGDGSSHTELVLQPPTIGQLLESGRKATATEQNLHLLTLCSGLKPQVVILLPPQVLTKASAYFARFTEPSPEPDPDPAPGGIS